MNIKIIIAYLFTLLIVKSSFAFDILDPLPLFKNINAQTKSIKHTPKSYINFSGIWRAICDFNGDINEEIIVIENTAEYIQFGNYRYYIGDSLFTQSTVRPQNTFFDHKQLEWSEDGTFLIGRNTKVVSVDHGQNLLTYLFSDIIKLVNDEIIIDVEIQGYKDMKLAEKFTGSCVLKRTESQT